MALKVYTQAEVDAILPDKNGVRHFPSGDYTDIKQFPMLCVFGPGSSFSTHCKFNKFCSFEENCAFGQGSSFKEECEFGPLCVFGSNCIFEEMYKAKTTLPFIALSGAGSYRRTCYFFDFTEGIYVRAGCFFETLAEFKTKVLEAEENHERPSKMAVLYLGFCDLAEVQFL